MQISTPSSLLRDWRPDDAGSLARYANNPRIAEKMRDGFPSPYAQEDAERFIEMAADRIANLFLAIEVDGEPVGGIGVHQLADVRRRSAEIGYWLAEPCWGRGIATDAVRSMVPAAFEAFDIVRLEAGIFSNNPSSMRVLEKCGFVREAVHAKAITKGGVLLDEVMYVFFR